MKLLVIFGSQKHEVDVESESPENLDSEMANFYQELSQEPSSSAPEVNGEGTTETTTETAPTLETPGTVKTLGQLRQTLAELTAVPVDKQRLIAKGDDLPLSAFQFKDGDKLMLLGSAKPSAEEDATKAALKNIESGQVAGIRSRLTEAESSIQGMESGFLPQDKWAENGKQVDKRLKLANEECMRALFALDALSVPSDAHRKARKELVLQVQELLNVHDGLVERLATVLSKDAVPTA